MGAILGAARGRESNGGVVATGVEELGKRRHRLWPRRYVATFAAADVLGLLINQAAHRVGGDAVEEQIVLGNGARGSRRKRSCTFPLPLASWTGSMRHGPSIRRFAPPSRAGAAGRRRASPQTPPDLLWHGDLDGALAAEGSTGP